MADLTQDHDRFFDATNGTSRDFPAPALAPRLTWSAMNETEHFVQFYENDAFLVDSLSGFIGKALGAGEAGIVVATQAHRDGVEQTLRMNGLDVHKAASSGQYLALDAAETLSKMMQGGLPEPSRFSALVADKVRRATQGWPRVRVYGELVALLWADRNYNAAIKLEEMWNDLRRSHSFSLFCAYPIRHFSGEALANPLRDVCTTHTSVIPAESYNSLASVDDRLRAITLLQQQARSLEAEIAERNEAEKALRLVKEELEELLAREQMARAEAETANRMKDEFLATVSHELRTPLNAIIGWTHMLRSGGLDGANAARAIETIERNAKSQAQLIEDILDVSRMVTGKLRLNTGPVDVASVINAAIDSVQLAAESRMIQLKVTLDPSSRHISGDSSRLQQVVWNLLSNAIKFTPSGGRVEVRLEGAGADVQIKVSDSGQGISRTFLPFIFERFRQADGTSTRRHGGLGLGLAIVRHLVELHGGTVHADSPGEGRGSTFTVRLPVAVAREETRNSRKVVSLLGAGDEKRFEVPSLQGVKVLLVDDDKDTLEMMAAMLVEQKGEVQSASSVSEALEILEWYQPDVLVSDLAMPGEDGYSLIAKLRSLEMKRGKRIPAVALTAYVRVEDRAQALAAGFNMFVPKPVEPNELILAVANLAEPAGEKFGQV